MFRWYIGKDRAVEAEASIAVFGCMYYFPSDNRTRTFDRIPVEVVVEIAVDNLFAVYRWHHHRICTAYCIVVADYTYYFPAGNQTDTVDIIGVEIAVGNLLAVYRYLSHYM